MNTERFHKVIQEKIILITVHLNGTVNLFTLSERKENNKNTVVNHDGHNYYCRITEPYYCCLAYCLVRDISKLEEAKKALADKIVSFADSRLREMIKDMEKAKNTANCIMELTNKTGCHCVNVAMGSYDNQVELPAPQHLIEWAEKVNFSLGGERKTVCVDKCLEAEVKQLWAAGITTTGCCCGHGSDVMFIGVVKEDVEKMKAMGYEPVKFNTDGKMEFIPKSI